MKWKERWGGSQNTWILVLTLTQSLCDISHKMELSWMWFSQQLNQGATLGDV